MKPQDLIFFEYSPTQDAFHVHTAIEHIKCNLQAMIRGHASNYHVIAIFRDWDHYEQEWRMIRESFIKSMQNITIHKFEPPFQEKFKQVS